MTSRSQRLADLLETGTRSELESELYRLLGIYVWAPTKRRREWLPEIVRVAHALRERELEEEAES